MLAEGTTVYLLDVDNTLLDNDGFAADLGARLESAIGAKGRARYWALYAELRVERGYADYLATLQRLRTELDDDQGLVGIAAFVLDYPFEQRLYPHARGDRSPGDPGPDGGAVRRRCRAAAAQDPPRRDLGCG